MAFGSLQVILSLAEEAKPVANALIRIFKDSDNEIVFEEYLMSNDEGMSPTLSLDTVERGLSLDIENDQRPYVTYNAEVILDGFETLLIQGIQIFADELSTLNLSMIPLQSRVRSLDVNTIPDHHLLTNYGGNNVSQSPADSPSARCLPDYRSVEEGALVQPERATFVLKGVVIPRTIRVHLGRPTANAENVTVDFIYYIKNVCSSEVYPTWPRQALLANIHAQVSLALNRVYTEWYRSKGYDFDITNNTAFDQAFVKNRNIYESVSILVDEVFNFFLRKRNFAEPFYAEYCDGKIAQCPGMKQWGTLTLANQGLSAIEILQRYYTTEVRLVSTERIEDVKGSYPGTPIRPGSQSDAVHLLQQQLNAIAVNYPNIKPIYPVDGIYGPATENAVRVFQRQFKLTVDGIVGKSTWYKINYIYIAVRKLAELTSIGRIENDRSGEWPGIVLRQGSRGVEVQQLQFYLSSISTFVPAISQINSIDGSFGNATYQAVRSFQRQYGLVQDGVVGQATWNRIYEVYRQLSNTINPPDLAPVYPGNPVRLGASGQSVAMIQAALNTVGQEYPSIQVIVEDAIFGPATQNSVRSFQRQFNLTADGIVGPDTWNKLFEIASQIENGSRPSPAHPPFPGTILRNGSRGNDVRLIQERLNFIAIYYSDIPSIVADGIYGPSTERAVLAFQQMLGLTPDGIVGLNTWDKIMQVFDELNS